ncbi:MAG TPA: hypothetical protein VKB84_13815 [Candidatus Binataceae bacterium]|nr:hypothetical protein [Candidatus Binataceae bacterium]
MSVAPGAAALPEEDGEFGRVGPLTVCPTPGPAEPEPPGPAIEPPEPDICAPAAAVANVNAAAKPAIFNPVLNFIA